MAKYVNVENSNQHLLMYSSCMCYLQKSHSLVKMAKTTKLQQTLKRDILDVLYSLDKGDLHYEKVISVKGSLTVAVDEKRLFVIKIQEKILKGRDLQQKKLIPPV